MEIKKYCCTCKWYSQFEGVCCNGESEHRAYFRFMDDTCEQWETNTIEFFMAMIPPTVTHQEKQVHVVNGKPVFYEPAELKAARTKLRAHMSRHGASGKAPAGAAVPGRDPSGGKMVLSKREAGRRYIPHHEAGYRQPAEAFKGLHDSLRILEG